MSPRQDGSTRFVFLSTDAPFQEGEDYPTVEEVREALENNDIIPIFLVAGVNGTYESLVSELGRGEVISLSSDSSNVTDAVRLAFAEINGEVSIRGTDDDDVLTGDDSDNGIFGGLGDDVIDGLAGDDILDGGAGNDEINGSTGNDAINGGSGEDVIDGGAGDDEIKGGLDVDILTGSEGADIFAGTLAELDGDTILDFSEDDSILIEGTNFGSDSLDVTQGSAILDIDSDLDGSIDSTITLEGDFTGVEFIVESQISS